MLFGTTYDETPAALGQVGRAAAGPGPTSAAGTLLGPPEPGTAPAPASDWAALGWAAGPAGAGQALPPPSPF